MRTTLLDILKDAGAAASTSKGRRLILQGAISLNDKQLNKFDDLDMTIFPNDVITVLPDGVTEIYTMVIFACDYFEKMEQ